MYSELEKHGSQLSPDLLQTLNTRMELRRLGSVISLMYYLFILHLMINQQTNWICKIMLNVFLKVYIR